MISAIVQFSVRHGLLVLVVVGLLAVCGLYALPALPIDAFPDVTNIQVQILTAVPGRSPIEVERFVTFPIELQLTGLPGLTEVRSLSKFALSQVTVVFQDGTDLYRARQLVLERLIEVRERLPAGVEPVMAPITTGLGEVYQYYLEGPRPLSADPAAREAELTAMRTVQDWVIRPRLKTVPGVIDVNSLGGYIKQYQVLVEPAKLRKYNLKLAKVFEAVANNNATAGGNVLERHAERAIVRGVGLIRTVADIENIVVKEAGGTPVFVGDVAEVRIGQAVRHGAAVLNGEREVVAGVVLMLRGANAREVVEAVKRKVEEIHQQNLLPDGLRIVPFYDRSELVTAALRTVREAVFEGVLLVILVLFLFMGNVRSALVVTATLLITPLMTFLVMGRVGLTANLMSLGGLAIAIGEIADGSVVMVENISRHLSQHQGPAAERRAIVLRAANEVARPVLFGILIISVVFLPLMTLEGMEGKLFAPLAITIVIALLVSVSLSLTLSPALSTTVLRSGVDQETWLIRWAKRGYLPALQWALAHRAAVLTGAVAIVGVSVALIPFLGREFIPILDEGALTPQIIRLPSVSLPESIELEKRAQRAILEFPEVRLAVSKIGRSEIANTPEEPNESDPVVLLTPRKTWTTAPTKPLLVDAIRRRLADVPGISVLMSQPIQERVDELISGVKTEGAIKVFGDDLELLKRTADQIEGVMQTVPGVKDLKIEPIAGQPYLTVDIDRARIARYGINVSDIEDIIVTAVGGKRATQVYEGERWFPLILRFPEAYRTSIRAIGDIRVSALSGAPIPLSELATIGMSEGPARISREHARRRIYIGFNVLGRDIAGVVAEGQRKLAASVVLPPGYTITWGGTFENMERAMRRLAVIVPITVALIFLLLVWSFNSVRDATLVILNLPFALVGGVAALWVTGQYLSVPSSIGFIELFGVAVGNGIVLVSYINHLRTRGMYGEEAIVTGCLLRLRPVLMTMMTTLLGLLPLAAAQGIGAEVQRPLAIVVIGGLVTSTTLTLVVLPVLYGWAVERRPPESSRPGPGPAGAELQPVGAAAAQTPSS